MTKSRLTTLFLLFAMFGGTAAMAEDAPTKPWSDTADLSAIFTTGNSETKNFALANKYVYKWSDSQLSIDAAALRTETTTRTLSNPDGNVLETNTTEKTAETYSVGAKYRHDISEKLFWYVGAGWLRNRFAGLDNRTSGGAGIGYTFFKNDGNSLIGEVGADYTDEQYVAGDSASFAGARGYLGYEHNFSKTSKFTTDVELLENLDTTDDWRGKSVTALVASLTTRTALKVSYTLLYDNQPVEVVVAPDATAPPLTPDATFAFDKLDTILAASVVINF